MDEIANYSESVFEDIKHVNEYSQGILVCKGIANCT